MYAVDEPLEIWATLLDAVEIRGGGYRSVHCGVSRELRLGEHLSEKLFRVRRAFQRVGTG